MVPNDSGRSGMSPGFGGGVHPGGGPYCGSPEVAVGDTVGATGAAHGDCGPVGVWAPAGDCQFGLSVTGIAFPRPPSAALYGSHAFTLDYSCAKAPACHESQVADPTDEAYERQGSCSR